jgi:hypothetical protein
VQTLRVEVSDNGVAWQEVSAGLATGLHPNDSTRQAHLRLSTEVRARLVRLMVLAWHAHISLRAGLLIAEEHQSSQMPSHHPSPLMGIPAMGAMGQTIGQTAQQAMAAHGDLPLRSLNRDEALRAGAKLTFFVPLAPVELVVTAFHPHHIEHGYEGNFFGLSCDDASKVVTPEGVGPCIIKFDEGKFAKVESVTHEMEHDGSKTGQKYVYISYEADHGDLPLRSLNRDEALRAGVKLTLFLPNIAPAVARAPISTWTRFHLAVSPP